MIFWDARKRGRGKPPPLPYQYSTAWQRSGANRLPIGLLRWSWHQPVSSAIQIERSFAVYGKHLRVRRALVYGGVSQVAQVRALHRGADILVATPGRLLDLMNQGHVRLDQLEIFVLDEADRMLDMGFLPDLRRIMSHLPPRRQSLFFSATVPDTIIELSRQLLHDPVRVNVTPKSVSLAAIRQQVFFVERKAKSRLLHAVLASQDVDQAIVFTRTKRGANLLSNNLLARGIQSAALHGNKSQNARQQALSAFRSRDVRVLVATDLAARGIDIVGISHVINFDLPDEPESYVHRIGRTGRAGAAGTAFSFCSSAERQELRAIEKLISMKVPVADTHEMPPDECEVPRRHRRKKRKATSDSNQSRSCGTSESTSESRAAKTKPRKARRRRGRVSQSSGGTSRAATRKSARKPAASVYGRRSRASKT